MERTQFRILYRQFLFRMVDLEMLSADAQGDLSKLFGQFAALLIFLSIGLAFLAVGAGEANLKAPAQLIACWSAEHFLIATTMLVVGLFAVLSWDSTFPDRRDVFVLAPLPVRPRTMFLAKAAAVATALAATVAALHIAGGLVWPLALNKTRPTISAPAITYDRAMPAVGAAALPSVLNRDLGDSRNTGFLAPRDGGGASIGVWKHGVQRVFAYGSARPDSIFEIGSISKVFTGLLLARLAEERKMRLDEPVRELLPPGIAPRPHGDEITLLDLITHRSGLPADAPNLHGNGKHDPFAGYSAADLYSFLARRGFGKPVRAPFAYSNVGVALLGQAMSNRAGASYSDLVAREITAPLGMSDTVVHLTPWERPRLIRGYAGPHNAVEAWDLDAYAPAGGIHSTAPDMLKFLSANLSPERARKLATAIACSHKLRAEAAEGWSVALGWLYNRDLDLYWHNGATAGYTSSAFFSPKGDYAGIVLLNRGPDSFGLFNVFGEHIRARLAGDPAISLREAVVPPAGGLWDLVRLFVVYWLTMFAAGAFIFCSVLAVQGLAAQILTRQQFLRASSFLQMGAFVVFVTVYFLEPKIVAPGQITVWQSHAYINWSPSYWFLGLFQELSGSPALAPLARRAWSGLALALFGTAAAYSLSYWRTMRQIVETPDIVAGARAAMQLPHFGTNYETAVGQFSVRTLLRSRQHRLMVAFFLGVGFAAAILLPRWPLMRELSEQNIGAPSLPALGATVLLMGLCVLATRVAFSLPLDLRANWIFRIMSVRNGRECLSARRRAYYCVSVIPVWAVSAAFLWSTAPWRPAAEHSLLLAAVGVLLIELALLGDQKIPFTCSYLPGKSNFHITFLLCVGFMLNVIVKAVQLERESFSDAARFAVLAGILAAAGMVLRWWNNARASSSEDGLRFEEEADPAVLGLDLN